MRIVLDTNILVRAHAKARGPARELLQLIVGSPRHLLIVSPFLLQELERVFSYERVRATAKLTSDEIAEYLDYLVAKRVSEIVFPGPAPRVVLSDPDDDPVVHTAVVGSADVLCTLNRISIVWLYANTARSAVSWSPAMWKFSASFEAKNNDQSPRP
jgi:putative PIN family toxin of toxin-antitoxin system